MGNKGWCGEVWVARLLCRGASCRPSLGRAVRICAPAEFDAQASPYRAWLLAFPHLQAHSRRRHGAAAAADGRAAGLMRPHVPVRGGLASGWVYEVCCPRSLPAWQRSHVSKRSSSTVHAGPPAPAGLRTWRR